MSCPWYLYHSKLCEIISLRGWRPNLSFSFWGSNTKSLFVLGEIFCMNTIPCKALLFLLLIQGHQHVCAEPCAWLISSQYARFISGNLHQNNLLSTLIDYFGRECIAPLMWSPTLFGREKRNFLVVAGTQLCSSFLYIYVVQFNSSERGTIHFLSQIISAQSKNLVIDLPLNSFK